MKFTGLNTLYTPRVSQLNYSFKNIVVDTTGEYTFCSIHFCPTSRYVSSTGTLFSLVNGRLMDASGRFVSTYNTGEMFSTSGWLDFVSNYRYLFIDNSLHRTIDTTISSGVVGAISITCPTSGALTCDILLNSCRMSDAISFSNFPTRGSVTGYITASHDMFVNNDTLRFYQSYETLLTGGSLLAFVDTRYLTPIVYYDADSSSTNNAFTFDYSYSTTFNQSTNQITLSRTGLYDSGIVQLIDLNDNTTFSGLFDGVWSGNRFVYQDERSILSLNYLVLVTDAIGNPYYPITGRYEISIPSTGRYMKAEYISGFSLTSSGEYSNPPLITVTGYYSCTGIQQTLQSLLFSSGCSGNLQTTFSGGGGAKATGELQLATVLFTGVYSSDAKYFRIVNGYTTVNIGTGYTSAPKAYVNTGMYGIDCFDVPLSSGYNYAWFKPFDTSGTMDVEAGYFTGVALCVTGIMEDATTGYFVTGIDVYNIGTGYNNLLVPFMSFVRTGADTLTKNASGILFTNTGSINNVSGWKAQVGVAGTSLTNSGFIGNLFLNEDPTFAVDILCSGLDITEPITGRIIVWVTTLQSSPVTGYFTYSKYFDISPTALKKKDNELIPFSVNTDLSFLLSQGELDSLYSSAGYTNNNWPFTEGDFDF